MACAESVDVCVVGAGPAGLAAAVAAAQGGARVMLVDREEYAGGVLPQCVHDGFGLHVHGCSLTGPEYAHEWERRAHAAGVRLALATTVLGIARASSDVEVAGQKADDAGVIGGFVLDVVGAAVGGHVSLHAGAVVVATGCRERTRGQLGIPGTRPAGVLTAGTAQYMMNIENQLPGDKVVILGSGDVGLIMARRLTLEGAQVRLVLGQEATGLLRNHLRCIEDFGLPVRYGWGLASVHGTGQLKGVTVAPLLPDGRLDMTRHEYVRCNLLLIACGLIPEREVLAGLPTSADMHGVFVCGNANTPHDLADQVTQEGLRAGVAAVAFARGISVDQVKERLSDETRRILSLHIAEPKGRLSEVLGAQMAGGISASIPDFADSANAAHAAYAADALASAQAAPECTQGGAVGEHLVACTVCPAGCVMRVSANGAVRGNACVRGKAFAHEELTSPKRQFSGTVKLRGAADGRALVPVRTAGEVPRDALMAVARACRRITAQAPLRCGQVICTNVAGTGVGLVACASIDAASGEGAPA